MATVTAEQRRVSTDAAEEAELLLPTTPGRVTSVAVLTVIAGVQLTWVSALGFLLYRLLI